MIRSNFLQQIHFFRFQVSLEIYVDLQMTYGLGTW